SALKSVTPVTQLHLGGGTPTLMDDSQLQALIDMMETRFAFASGAERSIEIDPRPVDATRLKTMHRLGFIRISLGVQDFDHDVQLAVHRIQPESQVFQLRASARDIGFDSVNVDLIYGLPRQTTESFARTMQTLVRLAPDRVAVYAYAHLPERFKPQRRIDASELPSAGERVNMLRTAITVLTTNSWDYIGMDHFARNDDALAVAKREGRLHRNFQGYTTQPDCDLVALGASAISWVGANYAQHVRTLNEYYDCVENGRLPAFRGHAMSADDLLRYAVLMSIMCQGDVRYSDVGMGYLIDFREYFGQELIELDSFADQELVQLDSEGFSVTDKGWFVVRAIARIFDRYARHSASSSRLSRIL